MLILNWLFVLFLNISSYSISSYLFFPPLPSVHRRHTLTIFLELKMDSAGIATIIAVMLFVIGMTFLSIVRSCEVSLEDKMEKGIVNDHLDENSASLSLPSPVSPLKSEEQSSPPVEAKIENGV